MRSMTLARLMAHPENECTKNPPVDLARSKWEKSDPFQRRSKP